MTWKTRHHGIELHQADVLVMVGLYYWYHTGYQSMRREKFIAKAVNRVTCRDEEFQHLWDKSYKCPNAFTWNSYLPYKYDPLYHFVSSVYLSVCLSVSLCMIHIYTGNEKYSFMNIYIYIKLPPRYTYGGNQKYPYMTLYIWNYMPLKLPIWIWSWSRKIQVLNQTMTWSFQEWELNVGAICFYPCIRFCMYKMHSDMYMCMYFFNKLQHSS